MKYVSTIELAKDEYLCIDVRESAVMICDRDGNKFSKLRMVFYGWGKGIRYYSILWVSD
jgi:hypothetical protein